MRKKISLGSLTIMLVLAFILSGTSVHAAQFTADLIITGPDTDYTFKLYVKDNMYRLEKVKGGMKFPPYPTIVNRNTGLTWGLNPQVRQYVEMTNIRQTMMMNPIIGWEFMRKDMEKQPGPIETLSGYTCETSIYHEPRKSRISAKIWISRKLDHFIKQVHYADNSDAIMELQNIKEGPVDEALFKIPQDYSKMEMPDERQAKTEP